MVIVSWLLSPPHDYLSCRSKWHQRRKGALERIAAACPRLAELDCSGAHNLTGDHLEAAAAGGGLSSLTRLALARCDSVHRAGPLLATLGRLAALDLSHTGVQVAHARSPACLALLCRMCRMCWHVCLPLLHTDSHQGRRPGREWSRMDMRRVEHCDAECAARLWRVCTAALIARAVSVSGGAPW